MDSRLIDEAVMSPCCSGCSGSDRAEVDAMMMSQVLTVCTCLREEDGKRTVGKERATRTDTSWFQPRPRQEFDKGVDSSEDCVTRSASSEVLRSVCTDRCRRM